MGEKIKKVRRIKVHLSEQQIADRVAELGKQISRDYGEEELILVCILKGSVLFTCDLARCIESPVQMEFMSVSSYGNGTESSGNVEINMDLKIDICGKNVLIIEDIVDSGRTLSSLAHKLQERNPKSLRICTLLDKPERRVCKVDADYVGFEIPDGYVIGYGLDHAQLYRNLPYIGFAEFEE